jgi:hypothetical protein
MELAKPTTPAFESVSQPEELISTLIKISFEWHAMRPQDELNADILRSIIPGQKSTPEDGILLDVYNRSAQERGRELTVGEFIDELVDMLLEKDEQIKKIVDYKKKCQFNISKLQNALKLLREREIEMEISSKDRNTLKLKYIKEQDDQVLQKYKIKFKAGTSKSKLNPVSSENKPNTCTIPITLNTDAVWIEVIKIPRHGSLNKPQIIEDKQLPLNEVYTSIKEEFFVSDTIPPTYLFIPYEDYDETSGIGHQQVELEFNLNLDFDFREKKLIEFMEKWKTNSFNVDKKKEALLKQIHEALTPFNDKISYNPDKGFHDGSKKKDSVCQSCTLI